MTKYAQKGNSIYVDKKLLITSDNKEQLNQLLNLLNDMQNKIDFDSSGAFSKAKLAKDFIPKKWDIAYVDLNNLKIINDISGHKKGDQVIKKIVNILKKYGNVYRVGGDEFMLFIDSENMLNLLIKENKHSKDFSFGIVKKNEYTTFAQAYYLADKRMYKNKLCQKNSSKIQEM